MYGDLQQIYAWLFLFWRVGDWDPSQLLVPRAYGQVRAGTEWKDAEKLLGTAWTHHGPYHFDFFCGWQGIAHWETRFCTVFVQYEDGWLRTNDGKVPDKWYQLNDGKVVHKWYQLNSDGVEARRQLVNLRSRLDPILTPSFRFVLFVEGTIRAIR
jgi:hypothetical protein